MCPKCRHGTRMGERGTRLSSRGRSTLPKFAYECMKSFRLPEMCRMDRFPSVIYLGVKADENRAEGED